MKVALVTLGCKLNYAETSTWERGLVAAGWEVVPWSDPSADVYIVNTCTVTEHSDKKSRNIIRKLHRLSPDARIIVTGCSAELRRPDLESIPGVDRVFGATEKSSVVPHLLTPIPPTRPGALRQMSATLQNDCPISQTRPGALSTSAGALQNDCGGETYFPAYSSGERTRSFLKVQDGCNFKCHYCTVPYARGESRNAPISEVLVQANEIAAAGIKEIVLTGVNTGDFGRSTGETFEQLIKELDKVEGIQRYRISSIEPNLLTEEIVDWIASGTKFLPHFHIPLQSGCDKILQAMGRRYLTADFAHKIEYIRSKMEKPGAQKVFFGIDVIVGFPGETDEDFQATYDFLKNVVKPSFIHIFPYSRRPGTPAAELPGQVQDSVKTDRVKALEELSDALHAEFQKANAGLKSKVLFEARVKSDADGRKGDYICGWSENYLRVWRPWDKTLINEIREVEL